MNQYDYFNPFRKTHVGLMKDLEEELVNDKDKIDVIKYGERSEHIFKNGKYLMTLNWAIV